MVLAPRKKHDARYETPLAIGAPSLESFCFPSFLPLVFLLFSSSSLSLSLPCSLAFAHPFYTHRFPLLLHALAYLELGEDARAPRHDTGYTNQRVEVRLADVSNLFKQRHANNAHVDLRPDFFVLLKGV